MEIKQPVTFAETLKLARWQSRLTIRQVGKKTGISNAMVCYYENGIVEPSFRNAAKLAVFLDFSLDEIASRIVLPE